MLTSIRSTQLPKIEKGHRGDDLHYLGGYFLVQIKRVFIANFLGVYSIALDANEL